MTRVHDETCPARLLIVTRNMPPTTGGIEKLMHRLGERLCARYSCEYIAPRGSRTYLHGARRVYELPASPAVLFVLLACLLVPFLLLRRRFDAVIAGNGLMTLATGIPARIRRVPLLTFVYGLDVVATHPLYRMLALPLIRSSTAVIACSSNTARLAEERGVARGRLKVITPGVDLPASLPPQAASSAGELYLVSVGRLVRRKGIADFVRFALPQIVARVPTAVLLVIGPTPELALRREHSELERLRAAIGDTGLENHVRLLGRLDEADLDHWMRAAKLHVFPVQDLPDDVEGFGLVALEAAAYGVPTVAFDAGGVRDAVVPDVTGILVEPGDYCGLASAACELLGPSGSRFAAGCIDHARRHGWTGYATEVMHIIDRMRTGNA